MCERKGPIQDMRELYLCYRFSDAYWPHLYAKRVDYFDLNWWFF